MGARLTSLKVFVVDTPMKVLRYSHDYFWEDIMVENRKDFVDPTTIANGKEYPKLSKAIKSTIPYSGSEDFEFDKDWIEIRNMLKRLRRVEHKGVIFNFKNSPSKYCSNTTF